MYIKNEHNKSNKINQKVFDQLLKVLKDKRRKIKINACNAMTNDDAKFITMIDPRLIQAINELIDVANLI